MWAPHGPVGVLGIPRRRGQQAPALQRSRSGGVCGAATPTLAPTTSTPTLAPTTMVPTTLTPSGAHSTGTLLHTRSIHSCNHHVPVHSARAAAGMRMGFMSQPRPRSRRPRHRRRPRRPRRRRRLRQPRRRRRQRRRRWCRPHSRRRVRPDGTDGLSHTLAFLRAFQPPPPPHTNTHRRTPNARKRTQTHNRASAQGH